MANNQLVLSTFLQQLDECLEDIIVLYPTQTAKDSRFLKCKMYFDAVRKTNPRLMIQVWKSRVNDKFRAQIDAKNVNFFVEELDFKKEAPKSYDDEVDSALNDLRWTIREMSEGNIEKCMRYVQNLCKLADMYQN
jgi:hypothetical protein